ncbi:MAG: 16S rRNA (guanine(966)-N(2))-methyltransferase RsmD [Gemmatimonas sp.]|nr:16S rRNA (guanine(966)-N(2))-methyltransferase RsmD [Gemmatimonas sp.]
MSELRIIAGQWRGRRITVPESGVRPTADRVREAWMSILQPHIPDAYVLDLCAGSGALGLECLSRGATHCDFVEQSPKVAKVLQSNIAALKAEAVSTVHLKDAVQFSLHLTSHISHLAVQGRQYQVALADPPYSSPVAEQLATIWLQHPFSDIFCIEHAASLSLPDPESDASVDRRRYGDTAITIYRPPS